MTSISQFAEKVLPALLLDGRGRREGAGADHQDVWLKRRENSIGCGLFGDVDRKRLHA
ncbi:hypothetical protein [Mesorhizobium sp.]|uniref:hypothetical protein n=1 Tax=Mesorhizobium sp. TaxID=1871066 RepID=UPI00257C56AB|nr:hypothetical protein [Mesorhizobium sp.]